MIPRYSIPEMAALFTDEARFETWLEVQLLAAEGWARVGVAPQAEVTALRERAPKVDAEFVTAVSERERATDHDVAAFVDVVQGAIGAPEGNWIHYGLTSSDVVDTALCTTLTRAADLLLSASDGLVAALKARAAEFIATPMAGRTHGMQAEPTTFGAKLALWCLQADRDRRRLRAARAAIAVGKLSGAVGTYSNIDPVVEEYVCHALGLTPVPATQVIARDRHAELLWACAAVGATVELIGTEVRHLARTEVGEAEEAFGSGQKGSSAMPHKRNPILTENLTVTSSGLIFSQPVLLALVGSGLERDAAYRIVQRDARIAWEQRRPFRAVLDEDPDVTLDGSELDEAFSLDRSLRHAHRFLDALTEVPT
ncbi:MAG TPA: lyase family protein [Acidimicrobiales bacterium]|nr:lyase family protein [Acidimicrobiales bacterium]